MPEYRKIEFNQLHKADIIFTTARYATISIAIRKATNSVISHTMLVSKQGWIVDSTEKGVQERPWAGDADKGYLGNCYAA